MLRGLLEGVISRFCGRYITNFSRENIDVSVSGTVNLTNIHLRTEEWSQFQLPYHAKLAFIGQIFADVPIALGGPLEIRISDVLVVFEARDTHIETFDAQRALQMWTRMMYGSLAQILQLESQVGQAKLSGEQFDQALRMADRLKITFANVFVRLEEEFSTFNTASTVPHMSVTASVRQVSVRSVTKAEVADDSLFGQVDGKKALRKMVELTDLEVRCSREAPLSTQANSAEEAVQFLTQKLHQSTCILGPICLSFKIALAVQGEMQLIEPILASLNIEGMSIHLQDEQIVFLLNVVEKLRLYMLNLLNRCRFAAVRTAQSASIRARYRWKGLRTCISEDFEQFSRKLSWGPLRWRAWFDVWRLCGRYVAVREFLMPYMGPDIFYDSLGQPHAYRYECLIADHGDERMHQFSTPADIPAADLQEANLLVSRYIGEDSTIDPFSLPVPLVRALYSLMLDLDARLGPQRAAWCRCWADERWRLRRPERAPLGESNHFEVEDLPTDQSMTLLVGFLDATNLTPVFGSKQVDAICAARLKGPFLVGSVPALSFAFTSVCSTKAPKHKSWTSTTTAATAVWKDIVKFSITPAQLAAAAEAPDEVVLVVDGRDRGLFDNDFGEHGFTFESLGFGQSDTMGTFRSHTVKLLPSGRKRGKDKDDSNAVRLRVACMMVPPAADMNSSLAQMRSRMNELVAETMAIMAKESAAAQIDPEDDVFILDPSIITIRGADISVQIPQFDIAISAVCLNAGNTESTVLLFEGDLQGANVRIQAENNPWNAHIDLSVDSIKINDVRDQSQGEEDSVMFVGRTTAHADINQTSTVGRFISEGLDISCFEWSAKVTFGRYTFKLSPRMSHSMNDDKYHLMWRDTRVLSHMLLPPAGIGLGVGNTNIVSSTGAKAKAAQLPTLGYIMGSPYDAFPRHANVVKEMKGSVRMTQEDGNGEESSPGQITSLSWISPTRRMDMDINIEIEDVDTPAPAPAASTTVSADMARLFQMQKRMREDQAHRQASASASVSSSGQALQLENARLRQRLAELEVKLEAYNAAHGPL